MIEILQIETINRCNARCVFCPVKSMKRPRGVMSEQLFKKIIDDAKEIGVCRVMPFQNGEPLLDPLLADRIAYVNKVLPFAVVEFYTNGALLTEEWCNKFSKVRLHRVNFSINSSTDVARKQIMGIPLTPTVENVLRFHKLCPDVDITVSWIRDRAYIGQQEAEELHAFWKGHGINIVPFAAGNWAGKIVPSFNNRTPCSRPGTNMVVLWDGRVCLCCYDAEGEVIFGDLNKQTVAEVWMCPEMKRYAELNAVGRRGELGLCKDCTTG